MAQNRGPMVSSLSIAFKRATTVTDDVTQAKKEHRQNLRTLVDRYMQQITEDKVEGIRNAKELVEVIKADLLLMGEATERKDETAYEQRISKLTQTLDESNPDIKKIMDEMLLTLNGLNDEEDESATGDTEISGGTEDGEESDSQG